MIKKYIFFILGFLLVADVVYFFIQHFHMPLDGDMAPVIVPSMGFRKVLEDPFGLSALLNNEVYAAPNRFFAHWSMVKYFRNAPGLLQSFLDPLDSVYAACAIAKTCMHILIIGVLAVFISGMRNLWKKDFLLAAVLIAPLFQTFGYHSTMGIVDKAITYAFFYALPLGLLCLYVLPFFETAYHDQSRRPGFLQKILLLVLAVVVSFNGPLVPPVVLIACFLVMVYISWHCYQQDNQLRFFQKLIIFLNKIPNVFLFYFILIFFLCLYSFYIGMNNSENSIVLPLRERYLLMLEGLKLLISRKVGLPLLILMIGFNAFLIKRIKGDTKGQKVIYILKWIIAFSIIYILLLPLGGYRAYRPYIVRYDTMIPVSLSLIFMYGITAYFLVSCKKLTYRKFYLTGVVLFLLIYTIADEPIFNSNSCEREALKKIARSTEKVIVVSSDCPVMAWGKISDYKHSDLNSRLLQHWGILKEKKFYYQK